jgi:Dolichyl-phosphate-mannose-protein mannosyltransferase
VSKPRVARTVWLYVVLVGAFYAVAAASGFFIDRPFTYIGPNEWVQTLTQSTSRFLRPEESGLILASLVFLAPAIAALAFGLARVEPGRILPDDRARRRLVLGLVATSVVLVSVCRFFVLRGVPLVDDERSYLFEARLLASGHTSLPTPPAALRNPMFLLAPGWMSKYPPGQALMLAPGVLLGAPWLTPLVVAGLLVLGLFVFVRDEYGPRIAVAAAAFGAFSPCLAACGATALSFSTMACASIWCFAALARSARTGRPFWNVVAGVCLGCAFLTRPLDACALAFAVAYAWGKGIEGREIPRPLVAVGAFVAGFAPVAAILPLWNWRVLGSPLRSGYVEARDYVFGFGVNPVPGTSYVHTPVQALGNLMVGIVRLDLWLLGWPASLLLVGLGLASPVTSRLDRALRVAVAGHVLLGTLLASSGVWDVGPSYLVPLAPLLIALAARGLQVVGRAGELGARWRRVAIWVAVVGVATGLVVVTPLRLVRLRALTTEMGAPWHAIATSGIGDAIVVLPSASASAPVGFNLGYPYEVATGPSTRARLCRPFSAVELRDARAFLGARLPVYRLTVDEAALARSGARRYALVPFEPETP